MCHIDDTVLELLACERADGCNDCCDPAGAAGESRGKRYHQTWVMSTRRETIGCKADEVRHVFREQYVPFRGSEGQNLGISSSGQPGLDHGAGFDAIGAKGSGQSWPIHLVEQELQAFEAAAVSSRCSAIRASISSG